MFLLFSHQMSSSCDVLPSPKPISIPQSSSAPQLPLLSNVLDITILKTTKNWIILDDVRMLHKWSNQIFNWIKFRNFYNMLRLVSYSGVIQRNVYLAYLYGFIARASKTFRETTSQLRATRSLVFEEEKNIIKNISCIVCKQQKFTTWSSIIENLPPHPCEKSLTFINRHLLEQAEALAAFYGNITDPNEEITDSETEADESDVEIIFTAAGWDKKDT